MAEGSRTTRVAEFGGAYAYTHRDECGREKGLGLQLSDPDSLLCLTPSKEHLGGTRAFTRVQLSCNHAAGGMSFAAGYVYSPDTLRAWAKELRRAAVELERAMWVSDGDTTAPVLRVDVRG